MAKTAIRDEEPEVEELLEDTRRVLRRCEELMQQSKKLVKHSRELQRDFQFLESEPYSKKQALRRKTSNFAQNPARRGL